MKVYDIFLFNDELDLLEIRLATHDSFVDKFILIESDQTMPGAPKPLFYEENKACFEKWNHKILNYNLKFPEIFSQEVIDVSSRAGLNPRNMYAWKESFNILESFCDLNDDDILLFGDLDEIVNPECFPEDFDFPDDDPYPLYYIDHIYCHWFLNYCCNDSSPGCQIITSKHFQEKYNGNHNNMWHLAKPVGGGARHGRRIGKGGWHFAWECTSPDDVIAKASCSSHDDIMTKDHKLHLSKVWKNLKDLSKDNRFLHPSHRILELQELPLYLGDNIDKFKNLLYYNKEIEKKYKPKLKLENVTLLTVHDKEADICLDLLNICQENIEFGKVKLFTSTTPSKELGNVELVKISPFGEYNPHNQSNGQNGYSEFMVNELHKFIDTDHVLIVQADGFVNRPDLWLGEFLEYDYIGASWPDFILHGSQWLEPEIKANIPNFVGNGGFSLRSKKILELAAQCPKELVGPEDAYYCLNNYQYFIDHGIKYAPRELANKFSKDDWGRVHDDCFGFHGNRDHINKLINERSE